jgi:hypothetical protein
MRRSVLLIAGASLAIAGIILIELYPIRIMSIPEDRFSGGSGGGYVNAFFPQNPMSFQIPPLRFSGAGSDGYSLDTLLHNGLVLIQPPIRFSGGLMDGSAFAILFELTNGLAVPPLRFSGGSADGYSRGVWLTIVADGFQSFLRFSGGGSDGYAQFLRFGITSNGVQSINRFFGGGYGGYAYRSIIRASGTSYFPAMRFWGGGMDGSAVFLFLSSGSYLGQFSPRYFGGGFDGSEIFAIRVPMTNIAADSDHDGIPDWWVNRFYTNVATFSATNDADGDGANAASEYLAGTDPAKPESAFKIGAVIQEGGSFVLTYPSTDFRIYTVQSLNNLAGGVWSNMPGHIRVPGGISGTMTTPIGITSNACMLRVLVEFP